MKRTTKRLTLNKLTLRYLVQPLTEHQLRGVAAGGQSFTTSAIEDTCGTSNSAGVKTSCGNTFTCTNKD